MRKQLKTAQQFGASPAQSALMKAQVDLLQEKSDEVVIELESIGGELANSTAAYAMLTIAYWHTGQEADCFRRLPALIDRPASTYQDRLLRGWAEVVHLPHHAVRDLEEAVHLRQSNMANLLLAEALTWKALYSPDRSKATEDVTRALDIHVHHVIELFRADRDQDAAQAFDRIAPSLRNRVDHIRAFIAMSSPNADRDQIAAEFLATKSLLTRDLQAMVYRHFDIWTLQLLGKATEAKEFAEESRQTTKQLEDTWPHFKVGNLASGDSAEEILEACSQDREALAHAYFALGVNCLAAGDWDVAKLQFKNVLETDQFPNYVYSWSAAFLQRLEDDPNWLPWLRKAHNTNGDSESSRD